jgi:hypothetical protein
VNEEDWTRLVKQLKAGRCTPFLGAGACAGTLPDSGALSERWAEKHHYPFPDRRELARVMQWAATLLGDDVSVREEVADELARTPPPDFDDPDEPHRVLARLPLPLYLTTNYDDYMVRALRHARRRPRQVISPWYSPSSPPVQHPQPDPPALRPEPTAPVVYHLHGAFAEPSSLVLTEDNYLEYLTDVAMDRGAGGRRLVPPYVVEALMTRPMLFVGYSLRDWTFQVLLRGLLRTISPVQHRRHVSVQLTPLPDTVGETERRRVEHFLALRLERMNVAVYWGTAQQFCRELSGRLRPQSNEPATRRERPDDQFEYPTG